MEYTINDIRQISVALTNVCNMSCGYCPHSIPDAFPRSSNKNVFPYDLYLNIIDYLTNLPNLEFVNLTDYNEFFLTPELTTFYLPELKKRNLNYIIATNGSIYPKDIEYYSGHNPKYLVIGLQTITEKQYYDTNRLKNMPYNDYIDRVSKVINYFYNNCNDTSISIEVAYNTNRALLYKILGCSHNDAIPLLNEQKNHIKSFIEVMSQKTGICFHEGSNNNQRYQNQQILGYSSDGRIIFGGKEFIDTIKFYEKMPSDRPPICFSEIMVFMMNGDVNACCIDYKNKTVFANVFDESMENIFQMYVQLINTMRTKGSPFECCRHCLGFNTYREKLAKKFYSFIKKV